MESLNEIAKENEVNYITEENVKLVLKSYGYVSNEVVLENYVVHKASNKMLGLLSDYWKVKVVVTTNTNERKVLSFFIKAISRLNAAKAAMVKELKIFEKELNFYTVIKNCIETPGMKPWSAKLVTVLDDALIFQDLNALRYKSANKFERFDMDHTLQALSTLARFHASSIIFEVNRSKELQRDYSINDEYGQFLGKGGYTASDPWFVQCMNGALETVKAFSKYSKDVRMMSLIESRWSDVWSSALALSDFSLKHRNVVCHRDLWNNNIMFHYKKVGDRFEPDDCVLVDFQAVTCQPPAGDIMLLLYCNLDPNFREENLGKFLNYYYQELKVILCGYGIAIDHVLSKEQFLSSAEEQRQWGLILCACHIPQFWIDDDLTANIFGDSAQFDAIMTKDKATFIKKMMQTDHDYRKNVMNIFEEIIEKYIVSMC